MPEVLYMARMYSGKKGKSGSKKPKAKEKPIWIRYSEKEIERLVVKLHKEENSTSKIGLILRDSYGIPDVKLATGKKITEILEKNKIKQEIPEDLLFLIKKANNAREHYEKHKQDQTAKRGITLTESKVRRLANHYKKSKKLPKDWRYTPELAKLLSA
jgi:small subunit ribosomal protein S15